MRWLALLGVVMVAGCGAAAAEPSRVTEPFASAEHRFTARLPVGWSVAAESLTPTLTDPREILAAGTMRDMRAAPGSCAHVPVGALQRMRSTDAFVTVRERAGGAPFPERPARFALDAPDDVEAAGCVGDAPALEFHWFAFRDAARNFHVLVAFGRAVTAERRAEALALLDSLRFEPALPGVEADSDLALRLRDADLRLSWVTAPQRWRRYDWRITSVDAERLALGTFDLTRAQPDPNCTPRTAIEALPADGAFIVVFEYAGRDGAGIPERAGARSLGPELPFECMGASRVARWREGERAFQAFVVLGPGAGAAVEREARSIVNSIHAW